MKSSLFTGRTEPPPRVPPFSFWLPFSGGAPLTSKQSHCKKYVVDSGLSKIAPIVRVGKRGEQHAGKVRQDGAEATSSHHVPPFWLAFSGEIPLASKQSHYKKYVGRRISTSI